MCAPSLFHLYIFWEADLSSLPFCHDAFHTHVLSHSRSWSDSSISKCEEFDEFNPWSRLSYFFLFSVISSRYRKRFSPHKTFGSSHRGPSYKDVTTTHLLSNDTEKQRTWCCEVAGHAGGLQSCFYREHHSLSHSSFLSFMQMNGLHCWITLWLWLWVCCYFWCLSVCPHRIYNVTSDLSSLYYLGQTHI